MGRIFKQKPEMKIFCKVLTSTTGEKCFVADITCQKKPNKLVKPVLGR